MYSTRMFERVLALYLYDKTTFCTVECNGVLQTLEWGNDKRDSNHEARVQSLGKVRRLDTKEWTRASGGILVREFR